MEPSSGAHPSGDVVSGNGNEHRPPQTVHAVVAYINGELGDFLYSLRQEIVPTCQLRSHVSLLPPRKISGDEAEAFEKITDAAGHHQAFTVELAPEISVFPETNVIYIDLAAGRGQLLAIYADLNKGALAYTERYRYHPHITLGQELTPEQFEIGLALCQKRWAEYTGPRSFRVETITFVRNIGNCGWSDLEELAISCQVVGEPALH